MKLFVDPVEIKANGCDGKGIYCDGGTSNWGLSDHHPVSVEQGIPWRRISRDNAIAECQSLGANYDLISNAEWQTISRNIEGQNTNWSGSRVGAGCISQGNISVESTCSYTRNGPERGHDARAIHELSNGEEIYHFSGNVGEWVKDNNTLGYIDNYVAELTI